MVELIAILGTYFSLAGVLVAIYQLRKTRKSAEAAETASRDTHEVLTKSVFIVDLSAAVHTFEEIILQLRAKRFESALLRIGDVSGQLQQLSSLPQSDRNADNLNLPQTFSQLTILRDALERHIQNPTNDLDAARAIYTLAKMSDRFNKAIGKVKYFRV